MSFLDLIDKQNQSQSQPQSDTQGRPQNLAQNQRQSQQKSRTQEKKAVLNPEQERAVMSDSVCIAVKAGPGTGKTKTLVSRLKYLLEHRRVRPSDVTAVTFTNQAAAELEERIGRETGRKSVGRTMQIGTFHAICLDFLKKKGIEFEIATDAELRSIAEETQCGSAKEFLESVSRYKSGVMTSEETDRWEEWQKTYEMYEQKKADRKLFDFDDLLLKTAELVASGQAYPGWEKQFRYLLIDEFQDINPLQNRLIRLWHSRGQELFVIGDPDQSIYGFRGADAKCFDRLAQDYPDIELIELSENYRSSPQILSAAASVMPGREMLRPNCPGNVPVRIVETESSLAEGIFIAKEIGRMSGGIGMLEAHRDTWENDGRKVRGFGEIAILYRTNRQSQLIENCLKKEGIPYIVAGREPFLEKDSVQGSICFFKYLRDSKDVSAMKESAALIWKLEWNPLTEELVRKTAEKFRGLYQKNKPKKFTETWMKEAGLTEDPAMQKLAQTAVFYKSMSEFLSALELGVESDLKRCGDKEYISEAVTLMTLHGSKGLEFPAVFIFGAEQGMIPLESEKHPADKEEERRLFYVGITRAKEELIMTCSGEKSEFLQELKEGEYIRQEKATEKKKENECYQMSLFEL